MFINTSWKHLSLGEGGGGGGLNKLFYGEAPPRGHFEQCIPCCKCIPLVMKKKKDRLSDLAYQSCVFFFFSSYFVLNVCFIHLRTIMGGLTTEEFKNLSCVFVLKLSCWPLIYFNLMLMSTGCLAPPAPVVIPVSQYSNFTFNIFIVLIYCWAKRVSIQIKIVVVAVVVVIGSVTITPTPTIDIPTL